jgi:ATP-dependent exoDNAse (exonuclease V) alpha subunit
MRQPWTKAKLEYPADIIPLLTQHYPMLQRNLLYTGVTRGKRLVVLVHDAGIHGLSVRGTTVDPEPIMPIFRRANRKISACRILRARAGQRLSALL